MEKKPSVLLDEAIVRELTRLEHIDLTSEDRSKAIDDLVQLYKLRIEEAKLKQSEVANVNEHLVRVRDQQNAQIDRWVNFGLQVGLTIGGWLVYDIWYRRGLRFEQFGTVTAPMTRNLISRMLPKK